MYVCMCVGMYSLAFVIIFFTQLGSELVGFLKSSCNIIILGFPCAAWTKLTLSLAEN